ncbi:MAG TPA: amino acid adenylation domain-containing protein, partial [Blastocatellia bacterium]|nr:amino acid adenylation domain-containing protein [Blastocatellia bacterium]
AQFAAQVAHHPHSVAIISGSQTLSYQDLDRRSNQLAGLLLSHHLTSETPIALLVSRSPMMIISLLAILKAGGAYLPLDPQSPPARQSSMLARAGVRLALTDQPLAAAAISQTGRWSGTVIDLHRVADEMGAYPETAQPIQAHPETLAYIIHTSGSTGEPKGVAVTHRNVLRLVCDNTYAKLDSHTRMLQLAPLAFDASTLEVWGPLLNGGCLAQSEMETPRAKELKEEISRHGITTLWLTAALFNAIVDEDVRALEGLEELLVGGEALSVKHVKQARKALPGVVIRNGYGPTEATTFTCCHVVGEVGEEEVSIPIGRGIENTEVYVLDEMMELSAVGVVGELYIGGAGISRGYYGREEETAERFVPNPYSEKVGERLYRSGDQVRWREGGELEYLGRRDGQVKVSGYRIELGEVEEALRRQEGVREAAVVMLEDKVIGKRMIGYVDGEVAEQELRRRLREELPEYMTPAEIVKVAEMPLTANGKVDRGRLPAVERLIRNADFAAPRDLIELKLVQIWEEVLQRRPIGVRENFFELGGHSLLAVRLFAAIEKRLGRNLPLTTLFQSATIEKLASAIRQHKEHAIWSPLVSLQTQGTRPAFFCVHPGGGGVFRYIDLARHLGPDQPFYAFQARGLDDDRQDALSDIETMAELYIEAMRRVQPVGPYLLGGWSMGGVVAFEMARQLQALGQSVSLLALLDTVLPDYRVKSLKENDPSLLMSFVMDLGLSWDSLSLSAGDLSRLGLDERLAIALARARDKGIAPPDIELGDVRRWWRVFNANTQALLRYRPKPIAARITLFQADEQPRTLRPKKKPNWNTLSEAGVDLHRISGDHFTIVNEPNVGSLARLLSQVMSSVNKFQ